ncbi:MAG: hypothetical protein IKU12_02660, partial [Oscillospiraceae bacterium]|nr:hypothetical protein [Oscillospiraceae bacterium]
GVVTVSGGAGIIAAVVQNNRDAEDSPSFMEEIRDNEETEIVVSAEIAAAYERILASSVTEHGTLTTYYAYVDLGRDGVPELVVADGTGSLDTTTTAELFCYENGEAVFYGKTFSENDYIYIVNEEHILARHPSGTQMINHEDFYASAKFFEDTDKTYEEFKAFSDAPNTNYGYSAENFKDYNAEPGEYAKLSKFKSARVLEFKENDISPVLLRDMIDLSKAWEAFEPAEPSDWAHIFVFKENGECIYILAIKDSEMLNSYYGTYEQTGDIINITLDWRNGEFANLSYRLAAQDDGFVLIQQSDEGIFYEHLEGFTMSFTASNAKTAEDMETLAAILSDPDYEEWW